MAASIGATSNVPHGLPRARRAHPSRQSLRGLDWFVFFLADVQVGFGAFVALYLTTQKWTQVDIGMVLSTGGLVALAGQLPGGALVDATRRLRLLIACAVCAIAVSALAIGTFPIFPVVLGAAVLHAAASCILGPAIAAVSLGLVGYERVSERLGRNASLASIGAGLAAAGMGLCGYVFSSQAVFFVTATLCVPMLLALSRIRADDLDFERAHGGTPHPQPGDPTGSIHDVLQNRVLVGFAFCMVLFHLANASMMPTLASVMTMRSSEHATILIGASMVIPQIVVALFSPWVGRQARVRSHWLVLMVGFAALPLRGLLFATLKDPYWLVAAQLLDGVSAAVLGVMVPLIIADATRGTGHFSLAQGFVGSAIGIGASLSTTLAGYVSDNFGHATTFLALAGVATLGFTFVLASHLRAQRGAQLVGPGSDLALAGVSLKPGRRARRRHALTRGPAGG
jgi:MFS family permease